MPVPRQGLDSDGHLMHHRSRAVRQPGRVAVNRRRGVVLGREGRLWPRRLRAHGWATTRHCTGALQRSLVRGGGRRRRADVHRLRRRAYGGVVFACTGR